MIVKQRGVALITALLVVAIASTVAISLVSRQQVDIRRTGNLLHYEQAYLYVLGMETWAAKMLRQDAVDSEYDYANEAWATQLAPIPIEGGELQGHIEDLQGRYNLNSLIRNGEVDVAAVQRFRRLLTVLELDPDMANALVDWMDPDQEPIFPGGGEDSVHLGMEPPHRSANTQLASTSELMLIPGFTAEMMAKLQPNVTAIPVIQPLNVNTAPMPVLMSLSKDIDESAAELLIEARGEDGFSEVEEFLQQPVLKDVLLPVEELGVKSHFFLLSSKVKLGQSTIRYQSMIQRNGSSTRSIMRAQGTL